jgi:hypothetical protein
MKNKNMTNTEYANSLRLVADFYEKNPAMPLPAAADVTIWKWDKESFLKAAIELSKGGKVQKCTTAGISPAYHAIRTFGSIKIDIQIDRSTVCRLVKPAQDAVYECPDSLLEEAAEFTEAE